jgi:heme A synthase
VHFHATLLVGLQCAQLLLGFVNVLLLAPIAVQLLHLFFADLVWINLIWMLGGLFTAESGESTGALRAVTV